MTNNDATIMAIDTALRECSVAIIKTGVGEAVSTLVSKSLTLEKGHAEKLAPMVLEALEAVDLKVCDVDRLVVSLGPGGFTGVRAGLAFARGLVLGGCVELIGISTLEALAMTTVLKHQPPAGSLIAAVMDARRSEAYLAIYEALEGDGLREVVQPCALSPEDAISVLMQTFDDPPSNDSPCSGEHTSRHKGFLVGSGCALVLEGLNNTSDWEVHGEMKAIDPVALAYRGSNYRVPDIIPAPLYLRAPDAKPSAKSMFASLDLAGLP